MKRKPKYKLRWMAVDPWGLLCSAPWAKRHLLVWWLKRKYPASWREYQIIRIEIRELPTKKVRGK